MNRVVLVGRLAADPDLKYTTSGLPVATLRVAVRRAVRSEDGQQADFIEVVVWRQTAEYAAKWLRKGTLVGVSGRLQTRSYERNGQRHIRYEVVADTLDCIQRPRGEQATGDDQEAEYDPFGHD